MTICGAHRWFICVLIVRAAGAEVQEHLFIECKQFFYMGTLPQGREEQLFKKICQFYEGEPQFVTLNDMIGHLPLAYADMPAGQLRSAQRRLA
uniref:Uncharacterized protein n=1 Tax=Salarias fasciatus TaxID=181472 RepID=A0A672HGR5_SALFA